MMRALDTLGTDVEVFVWRHSIGAQSPKKLCTVHKSMCSIRIAALAQSPESAESIESARAAVLLAEPR